MMSSEIIPKASEARRMARSEERFPVIYAFSPPISSTLPFPKTLFTSGGFALHSGPDIFPETPASSTNFEEIRI